MPIFPARRQFQANTPLRRPTWASFPASPEYCRRKETTKACWIKSASMELPILPIFASRLPAIRWTSHDFPCDGRRGGWRYFSPTGGSSFRANGFAGAGKRRRQCRQERKNHYPRRHCEPRADRGFALAGHEGIAVNDRANSSEDEFHPRARTETDSGPSEPERLL